MACDEATNEPPSEVPTGKVTVKGETSTLCKADKPVGTKLTRIGEKARKDPKLVFTSLYHHISDIDNRDARYDKLLAHKRERDRWITKEEYGKRSSVEPSGPRRV